MNTRERLFRATLIAVSMLTAGGCHKTSVHLVAGNPSGSLNTPTSLAIMLPILNEGAGTAENVQASSISLAGATPAAPATLPQALGTLPDDGLANLAAVFTGTFQAGNSYTVTVEGSFRDAGRTYKFAVSGALQIPPAAPGTAASGSDSSPAQTVNGANYPHQEPNFQ
jgi:hypothetical protein